MNRKPQAKQQTGPTASLPKDQPKLKAVAISNRDNAEGVANRLYSLLERLRTAPANNCCAPPAAGDDVCVTLERAGAALGRCHVMLDEIETMI